MSIPPISEVAKIRKNGDVCLTTVCDTVQENEDVSDIIELMWNTMYSFNGIGLAANQIGILKRIIIVHSNGCKIVLINPEIIKNRGKCASREACLSFPGKKIICVRASQIKVKGFDENWKFVTYKLRNIQSRCVQHEIDHLNGITILDKQFIKNGQ